MKHQDDKSGFGKKVSVQYERIQQEERGRERGGKEGKRERNGKEGEGREEIGTERKARLQN